jgi:hypothetical protein
MAISDLCHARRIGVLYHVTTVDDTPHPLLHQLASTVDDLFVACAAAAAYQYGYVAGYLYYFMVFS